MKTIVKRNQKDQPLFFKVFLVSRRPQPMARRSGRGRLFDVFLVFVVSQTQPPGPTSRHRPVNSKSFNKKKKEQTHTQKNKKNRTPNKEGKQKREKITRQ
jgi:hypothetical protein